MADIHSTFPINSYIGPLIGEAGFEQEQVFLNTNFYFFKTGSQQSPRKY